MIFFVKIKNTQLWYQNDTFCRKIWPVIFFNRKISLVMFSPFLWIIFFEEQNDHQCYYSLKYKNIQLWYHRFYLSQWLLYFFFLIKILAVIFLITPPFYTITVGNTIFEENIFQKIKLSAVIFFIKLKKKNVNYYIFLRVQNYYRWYFL